MKLTLTLALAALSLTAAASASAAEVGHSMSSGDYASYGSFDGDTFTGVSVYRNGSQGSATTWLNYYTSSCTYAGTSYSCTGANGWGEIPNDDFVMNGNSGNADLTTDASNVTGYSFSYSCDFETWYCSFEELPFSGGGWISASWSKSSEYAFKHNGRSEENFLNYTYIFQGRSAYSSASVEGNLFGQPFAGAQGSVGTSDGMSISIVKNY